MDENDGKTAKCDISILIRILSKEIKNLNKYRLMPAPYRIADVIETIATYYMDFF
jgi:hypothetical protein